MENIYSLLTLQLLRFIIICGRREDIACSTCHTKVNMVVLPKKAQKSRLSSSRTPSCSTKYGWNNYSQSENEQHQLKTVLDLRRKYHRAECSNWKVNQTIGSRPFRSKIVWILILLDIQRSKTVFKINHAALYSCTAVNEFYAYIQDRIS